MLRRRHAQLVVRPKSFYVADVAGPLREDELERARGWGRRVGAAAVRADNHAEAS